MTRPPPLQTLNRVEFHKAFRSPGPVVTPVVHVLDDGQASRNIDIAIRAGAPGVFLINHDFVKEQLIPILKTVRARYPRFWIGVNFLGVSGLDAFPILADLAAAGTVMDAYWADDARVDERREEQSEADAIRHLQQSGGWGGMYFGGVAFKKQRPVDPRDYALSARIGCTRMDVVTTSGVATGEEADHGKIDTFRGAVGEHPLALASGVTPENAVHYAVNVDCFLVATGISAPGDFYNIDPGRLQALLEITREVGTRV
ncbi:MAG: adenine phosphoribosyltransferase [Pseudomonadota bacterium]